MMPDPARIEEAVALLNAGELVAFPTETVYGLGADAANPAAVARIFAAKGRPASHPLIVHVSGLARRAGMDCRAAGYGAAPRRGILAGAADNRAAEGSRVFRQRSPVASRRSRLRAPAHPVARALLAAFGGGIAAPSANRYGRISPTRAADVREELGDRVALVLDGGDCEVGLESTIVACLGGRVTLLRPGAVSRSQLGTSWARSPTPSADRRARRARSLALRAAHAARRRRGRRVASRKSSARLPQASGSRCSRAAPRRSHRIGWSGASWAVSRPNMAARFMRRCANSIARARREYSSRSAGRRALGCDRRPAPARRRAGSRTAR